MIVTELDPVVTNSGLYVIGTTVGMSINWLMKWLNKEVDCIVDMLRTEPRRTIASLLSQFGVIAAFIGTGALAGLTPYLAFVQGAAFGSAVDAWVNKGKRRDWADEQREAAKNKPKD